MFVIYHKSTLGEPGTGFAILVPLILFLSLVICVNKPLHTLVVVVHVDICNCECSVLLCVNRIVSL